MREWNHMALPNFRMVETQARWSVYIAVVGGAALAALALVVFRGFDATTKTIPFDANALSMGKYRPQLVLFISPIVALLGAMSFGYGYSSLGERRNNLQGWSWGGMLLGAALVTLAALMFMAWRFLAVQVIR